MIFWVAFWMHVRGVRKPHFAWGLNHGNQRFFRGFYLWAARRVFREVDYFTVLSLDERDLFNKLYGIPEDKLLFRHWATAVPEVSEPLPEHLRALQPYICCIGRNNRDFETMFDAVRGLPVSLIVVCPTYALRAFDVPDNAKVLCDLSFQECMEIIKGSVANIVAVRDNTTGAGHMTIVSGMHLGKAQIVTEVEKARDYFVGGVHGFWAKPRSSEDMRTKIVRLLEDDVLRQQFETNASEFGKKWVSEESSIEAARHDLRSWLEGKHPGATPPGWEVERKRLDELAGSTA